MPVSSSTFFNALSNTEIAPKEFPPLASSINTKNFSYPLSNIDSIANLSYSNISEEDINYINTVNPQNNNHTHFLISLHALDAEQATKKKWYLYYLFHNLYFLESQVIVYRGYGKKEELELLKKIFQMQDYIRSLSTQQKSPAAQKSLDLYKLWDDFIQTLKEHFRTSYILPLIGKAHLSRIALVFLRITYQEILQAMAGSDYFIKLLAANPNSYAGLEVNFVHIIDVLDKSKIYLNSLSVALPALRLLLKLLLFLKHIIGTNPLERELPLKERIVRGIKKDYYVWGNDLVWIIINFITNFNNICRLTSNNALIITVAFMFFDVLWLVPGWLLAFQEFKKQHHSLSMELKQYQPLSREYLIIKESQNNLEIQWQAKNDTYCYNLFSAALFASGFIVAVLLSELAIPAYMMCNFAMALNILSDDFTAMREKKAAYENFKLAHEQPLKISNSPRDEQDFLKQDGFELIPAKAITTIDKAERQYKEESLLLKEYELQRNHFIATVIIYTVAPTITMAVFAVCWPAAIPLAAAFLAFQFFCPKWKDYQQELIANERAELNVLLTNNLMIL